jgi:hypothetical protein
MPRQLSTAMLDACQSNVVYPAIFLAATFTSGPVYLWTGWGQITFTAAGASTAHTYSGIGTMGSLSAIEEGSSVNARGITLTLSGVDTNLLTEVLTEFSLGAPVTVYLGFFTAAGVFVDTPIPIFVGYMDQPTIDVAGQSAVITIACENKLVILNVVAARRYTNDDQQLDYPGDTGLEFVQGLIETTIYFGATPMSSYNA